MKYDTYGVERLDDNELESIWREDVVTQFKVLSWNFPEKTLENRKSPSQCSVSKSYDVST
jgi:hypothetical protein